jgi:homocysteine S-methyltransferase
VGAALNLTAPDIQREIKIVGKKIEAGADFLLTQPIYSTAPLVQFLSLYQEAAGEKFPVPILAGILPLASSRHAAFLQQEVPGIDIPPEIHASMQQAGDQGAREGIRLAIELIGQLKSIAQGIYLMPAFGRFDYAAEIIETALK